jgi:hypothetical protein
MEKEISLFDKCGYWLGELENIIAELKAANEQFKANNPKPSPLASGMIEKREAQIEKLRHTQEAFNLLLAWNKI